MEAMTIFYGVLVVVVVGALWWTLRVVTAKPPEATYDGPEPVLTIQDPGVPPIQALHQTMQATLDSAARAAAMVQGIIAQSVQPMHPALEATANALAGAVIRVTDVIHNAAEQIDVAHVAAGQAIFTQHIADSKASGLPDERIATPIRPSQQMSPELAAVIQQAQSLRAAPPVTAQSAPPATGNPVEHGDGPKADAHSEGLSEHPAQQGAAPGQQA